VAKYVKRKLGLVGGGNMAEAMIRGLLAKRVFKPSEIIASDVDPGRRRKLARTLKVASTASNLDVVREAGAILLAVKPQTIDAVLAEIGAALRDAEPPSASAAAERKPSKAAARPAAGKLFISIAAGVPIARIERPLGAGARVIRVMPNAPAMVGHGMAALVRGKGASRADLSFALRLFQAVGDAVEVRDEAHLDAVTALSGSGPAYVYLFVKALADAAVNEGLPRELARRMALQTLRGAEHHMRASGLAPEEHIRIVASPGGTTEAALRRFAEHGFSDIVANAVHAAAARSRELGRSS
jgi:pyrroline-5-carboxylate reductase